MIIKYKRNLLYKKILILIISLFFLIPYIEVDKIRSLFTCYLGSYNFIPSVVIIMVIIMLLLLPLVFIGRVNNSLRSAKSYFASILWVRLLFDFLVIVRIIFAYQPFDVLFQYIWTAVPFYFAFFIVYLIHKFNLNIPKIHVSAIYLFTIYLIYNIYVNISRYGYIFGSQELGIHTRLISPGGGPVILGYTIAILFSLFLFYQNRIKKPMFNIIFSIMLIASFFTGSRGGMWPTVFLVVIYLADKKKLGITGLIIVLISFLYINPIEFFNEKLPRFFVLLDQSRISTALDIIEVYSKQSIFHLFFGKGLGMFFPYQQWCLYRTPGINYFIYDGMALLVQPHNSYIYLLIETGLLGIILFFYPLYNSIRLKPIVKSLRNGKYAIFTIILIGFLNLFDSVFIIAPGSAALWWLVLLSLTKHLYDLSKKSLVTNIEDKLNYVKY